MHHPFFTDKEIELLQMKAREEAEIEASLRYPEWDNRKMQIQKELEDKYFNQYTGLYC